MITRIAKAVRDDRGFSLVELSVALLLSSMVVGTFVTVFFAFSQNAADAAGRADHQEATRAVISEMVVELRQAVAPGPNADPIMALNADGITFYTTQVGSGTLMKVVYERTNCIGGQCQLFVSRYGTSGVSSGTYDFNSTPFEQSLLLEAVLDDQPLFSGERWSGNPKTLSTVSSCDGSTVSCAFPLVAVTLRALPVNISEAAHAPFEVHEEVRLRNA